MEYDYVRMIILGMKRLLQYEVVSQRLLEMFADAPRLPSLKGFSPQKERLYLEMLIAFVVLEFASMSLFGIQPSIKRPEDLKTPSDLTSDATPEEVRRLRDQYWEIVVSQSRTETVEGCIRQLEESTPEDILKLMD